MYHGLLISRLIIRKFISVFVKSLPKASYISVPKDSKYCWNEPSLLSIAFAELSAQVPHECLRHCQSFEYCFLCGSHLGLQPRANRPSANFKTVKYDRFDFRHFVDRIPRPLSPDSTAFKASIGHQIGAPQRGPVYLDHATLHFPCESPGRIDISSEYPRA